MVVEVLYHYTDLSLNVQGGSVSPEVYTQAHLKTNVLLIEESFLPHCLNRGVDSSENYHFCVPPLHLLLVFTLGQVLWTLKQLSVIIL